MIDAEAIARGIALDVHSEREWAARHRPAEAPRRPRRRRRSDDHLLRSIPPSEYIEALAGVAAPAGTEIRCPLHADGEERTPSLKVYRDADEGWFCFACGAGGGIYDFAGRLWGLDTKGDAFKRLHARLVRELLGGSE
jgi:hypothetical protein